MDEKFQEVCCTIRACLNSTKRQLSLAELSRDYKSVLGEAIPYQSLGYRSLEALVRAVPNLKITSCGNEIFIDVKPDEKTIHIANLVRGQRAAKKKSRKKSSYGRIYRSAPAPARRPFNDVSQRRRPSPPMNNRSANNNNHYTSRTSNNDHYSSRTNNNDNYSSRTNNNDNYSSRTNSRDHYASRPSNTDHYTSRTNNNDYHSAPRRDPPPQYQKKSNTPPISISSDDDFSEERIRSRYQTSRPSQYDFSDPNEFDDEGSDYDDLLEINNQLKALKVTVGSERQVSVSKQKFRGYQSTTSNDDDYGYSSMRTNNQSNGYINKYSDSYEDDDDGYPSLYVSSENSSTTDQLDSTNSFQASHSNSNRRVETCGSTNSRPLQKNRIQGGRGYRPEPEKQYEYSTNFKNDAKSDNIRVTVPNGSGRARVVSFLLR